MAATRRSVRILTLLVVLVACRANVPVTPSAVASPAPVPSAITSHGSPVSTDRYLVTARPIVTGHGLEQCVAVDPSGEGGVWSWRPDAERCSAAASGSRVARVEGARITRLPRTGQLLVVFEPRDDPVQVTLLIDRERTVRVGLRADAQVVPVEVTNALPRSA